MTTVSPVGGDAEFVGGRDLGGGGERGGGGADGSGLADLAALAGRANVAPMGPIVDAGMSRLIFRPFETSTTYQNLAATGEGVFHVVDDALLIARGAIGKVAAVAADGLADGRSPGAAAGSEREAGRGLVTAASRVTGVVLTGACRYYEVRVASMAMEGPRSWIEADVVHAGVLRDFFGFNRATHAVIEAAILATRLHLTGAAPVLAELDRLDVTVAKTGGPEEHQAMRELRAYVAASAAREAEAGK